LKKNKLMGKIMNWYERCKELREDMVPKTNQTQLGKYLI